MFLTIGSRSSELATAQANTVIEHLNELEDVRADLQTMDSAGDEQRDRAIPDIDETGVFTSRLDKAVAEGDVDAAVHSFKDLPTENDPDLTIAAVPPRTTPMDTLVGLDEPDIGRLTGDITIGTSSIRRRANLLHANEDIVVEECRGNVPSRLNKLSDDASPYDGLILAMAGLERLDENVKPMRMIRPDEIMPAPAQGAIAVVTRKDNEDARDALSEIDHDKSRQLCEAERSFLNEVEGGCQAPVGALAKFSQHELVLDATVTHPDGDNQVGGTLRGSADDPESLGRELAQTLLKQGADDFIRP